MKNQLFLLKNFLRLLVATAAFAAVIPAAFCADVFGPPSTIDYQGRLLDGAGAPLAPDTPANYEIQFRIYDEQTGGNIVWAEKQLATVSKGQFSVRLGEGDAILGDGAVEEGTVGHDSPGLPGAFDGKERYLGVTVVIPGQTPSEVTPRLAFLASPFSYVAASAQVAQSVNQPASSPPSNLNIGSVAYANQPLTTSGTIGASAHTVLVDSTAAAVQAALPAGTAALNRQLLITKKDTSANFVSVIPPVGGSINGETDKTIYLKVRGESITIQNVGGNDWWIVSESRDKTPVGTIISYASNNVPAGYIACVGTTLNRADYPDLFAAIGTQWGAPNGVNGTTFSLPQTAGRFLRGIDPNSNGADEEATSRYNMVGSGATGRNVGSYQTEQFKLHNHTLTDPGHGHPASTSSTLPLFRYRGFLTGNGANAFTLDPFGDGNANSGYSGPSYTTNITGNTTGITIASAGGAETRVDNAGVRFCIKY